MKHLSKVVFISLLILGGGIFGESNSSAYAAKFDSETSKKVHSLKKLKLPNEGVNKQDTKKNAWKKHNHAIKIVEKYYKDQGITVSGDFDDIKYQEQVMALGLAVLAFKKNEQDDVVEFIKFIDLYENYEQNNQIDQLTKKFDEGTISEAELYTLYDLGVNEQSETLDTLVTDEELNAHLNEEYTPNNTVKGASLVLPEDDTTPVTDPTTEDDPNVEEPVETAARNGYNYLKARDYAYKWTSNTTNLRNNGVYGYYSIINGKCHDCWFDCTNFVSQALAAGGMKYKGGVGSGLIWSKNWYYASGSNKPSWSWGGANSFYKHFSSRARVASKIAYLQTGDVVSIDLGGDSDIDHTVIITKNWGKLASNKYYTAHSYDSKEEFTLRTLINKNYKLRGIEMDQASN